jgi:hypothetical protein
MPKTKSLALGTRHRRPPASQVRAEAAVEIVRGIAPDLIVVVAYGQIIPASILEIRLEGRSTFTVRSCPAIEERADSMGDRPGESPRPGHPMLMDAGLDTARSCSRSRSRSPRRTPGNARGQARTARRRALLERSPDGNGDLVPIPQDDAKATLARYQRKRRRWSTGPARRRRFTTACAHSFHGPSRSCPWTLDGCAPNLEVEVATTVSAGGQSRDSSSASAEGSPSPVEDDRP